MASSRPVSGYPQEELTLPQRPYTNEASDSFVSTNSPRSSFPYPMDKENGTPGQQEKQALSPDTARPQGKSRSWKRWVIAAVVLLFLFLVIFLPVYFTVIRRNSKASASSANSAGNSTSTQTPRPTTGGDGSTVFLEDGTNFTYVNTFGGFWVSDPSDPFSNNARPNSWTPPLNASWNWATNRVHGVNIGGLFVLEPFITPALFQKYPGTVDEWTLSEAMRADTANGGMDQLEKHYDTFITEKDIADIAGAGLNWIRLPIPYWAIETWDGEPFLERVCWKYILRLLGWARKYGLRVKLDLHTVPGSQNGYNHSGVLGTVNFLKGIMGIANSQRTLDYIRILTEFIIQPEYKDLVGIFGIVNEPYVAEIGKETLYSFYILAHDIVRGVTGFGEGNGPYISIHDGFLGPGPWAGYMEGSDRVILDFHPYFAFSGQKNDAPVGVPGGGIWPRQACQAWGPAMNESQENFGVTIAGELSNGMNDCGLYLKGVTNGVNANYGDCTLWLDSTNWNDTIKDGLLQFHLATVDAVQHPWFWTWKIGAAQDGIVRSPLWSYQLGLLNGWMPKDPRASVGKCASLGVDNNPWDGTYKAWQTGGEGAGTIPAAVRATAPWPPVQMSGLAGAAVAQLPVFTPTAAIVTLPPPTLTASATKSIDVGNGWFNTADTSSIHTTIAGCDYPNAWSGVGAPLPTGACGSPTSVVSGVEVTPTPAPTPPPRRR